jgi:hypothetical protein
MKENFEIVKSVDQSSTIQNCEDIIKVAETLAKVSIASVIFAASVFIVKNIFEHD